jgi:hypothetical protein
MGVSAKVGEGVQMALDEGVGPDVVGKFGEAGTGIAQDHGETEEVDRFALDHMPTQVDSIDLRLFAWLGLESYLGADRPVPLDRSHEVLDDRVLASVSHLLDLF